MNSNTNTKTTSTTDKSGSDTFTEEEKRAYHRSWSCSRGDEPNGIMVYGLGHGRAVQLTNRGQEMEIRPGGGGRGG